MAISTANSAEALAESQAGVTANVLSSDTATVTGRDLQTHPCLHTRFSLAHLSMTTASPEETLGPGWATDKGPREEMMLEGSTAHCGL